MAKVHGSCPFENNLDFHSDKMALLPFVLTLNGIIFSRWIQIFESKRELNPYGNGIDVTPYKAAVSLFLLTTFTNEIYKYIYFHQYSKFMVFWGMIHGMITITLWIVLTRKIVKL